MPYIEQNQRLDYDRIINDITNKITATDDVGLAIWANAFKDIIRQHDLNVQDGEFNYFLTKLFIKLNWVGESLTYYSYAKTSNKIEKLVQECLTIYTPKYFNYNRAIGVLTCCQLEFKRRYGIKAIMAITFLQTIIKKYYETEIGPYEEKKMIENKDI